MSDFHNFPEAGPAGYGEVQRVRGFGVGVVVTKLAQAYYPTLDSSYRRERLASASGG